ncbi:MAG: hypothetical protein NC177_12415 [Ruminococcus flavefaciens]|nr:hypothetical protein [Ruminococcus flavefaciens]
MKNACTGTCKIYFPDNDKIYTCPKCGASLETLPDNKSFQPYYYDMTTGSYSPVKTQEEEKIRKERKRNNSGNSQINEDNQSENNTSESQPRQNRRNRSVYEGVITSYKSSEVEQNFFDVFASFIRGQHTGRTQHHISFRDETDNMEYQIIVYGEIRGIFPQEGTHIIVHGRPEGTLFTTERIYIGENGGTRLRLRNQHGNRHNPTGIIPVILILLAVIMLALLITGNLPVIRNIIQIYFVILIFIFILCICIRPLHFALQRPVLLLIFSIIGTLIWYNVFGLGAVFSGLLPSIITIAVIIYGIVQIIRSIR